MFISGKYFKPSLKFEDMSLPTPKALDEVVAKSVLKCSC